MCATFPQIKQRHFSGRQGGQLFLREKFKAAVYRGWSDPVTLDLCLSGSHVFGTLYKTQITAPRLSRRRAVITVEMRLVLSY